MVKVVTVGPDLNTQLTARLKTIAGDARQRARKTADAAAEIIVKTGQADISGAGKFGTRWTQGLTAPVSEDGNTITITVREAVPYWSVFQFGKIIQGKPLLWIPLSFAGDAQGLSARNYPGRLFRVDRKAGGAPLLLSAADKQPKYFGKESVRIPKKFHLVEIVHDVAGTLGQLYSVTTTG